MLWAHDGHEIGTFAGFAGAVGLLQCMMAYKWRGLAQGGPLMFPQRYSWGALKADFDRGNHKGVLDNGHPLLSAAQALAGAAQVPP
jgi:hypothetical protein